MFQSSGDILGVYGNRFRSKRTYVQQMIEVVECPRRKLVPWLDHLADQEPLDRLLWLDHDAIARRDALNEELCVARSNPLLFRPRSRVLLANLAQIGAGGAPPESSAALSKFFDDPYRVTQADKLEVSRHTALLVPYSLGYSDYFAFATKDTQSILTTRAASMACS